MLGPSGPRRLRLAIEHLAQHRGGIAFSVDLDPRWVIKLIKRGEIQEANLYKKHCIDQALTILRSHPNIKCMFTTPKLLEALADKIDLAHYGITGIFCGGTELTPQFHRFAGRTRPRHRLRPDLRQHADGPGDAQAVRPGGQLRDHLPRRRSRGR